MVIVCSGDALLIKLCTELFGSENEIRQVPDIRKYKSHLSAPGALLVLDLESCKEEDIPELKSPAVALASIPVYEQAMRLLQIGVRGYGNKHMHQDNLRQAAKAAQAGQVWLPPEIIAKMITSIPSPFFSKNEETLIEPLSKREEEVAQLVTYGLSNKEIAERINVSVRTVKAHMTSIFAKTGFRDRFQLAVKMRRF
jgi:DNA-binding NarL/FixJ family response regulator